MPEVTIRPATAADAAAVAALVTAAFGQDDEARLVQMLEADGDAEIALVAESPDGIVGHVLLSPMRAPFPALGLAPISVAPDHQRRGIGSALMRAAIDRARAGPWRVIFLLGDTDYYGRFGFTARAAEPFGSPYAGPHFQLLALDDAPLEGGDVAYAPAFDRL